MRDIFFTVLVIWVLWRIFGGIKRGGNSFTFNTFNNTQKQNSGEGEVTIKSNLNKKSNKVDEGEYVDFEEIKNK